VGSWALRLRRSSGAHSIYSALDSERRTANPRRKVCLIDQRAFFSPSNRESGEFWQKCSARVCSASCISPYFEPGTCSSIAAARALVRHWMGLTSLPTGGRRTIQARTLGSKSFTGMIRRASRSGLLSIAALVARVIPSPRATSDRRRSELRASMPIRRGRCSCSKRRWIALRKPQPSWLNIQGNGERSCNVAGEGKSSD